MSASAGTTRPSARWWRPFRTPASWACRLLVAILGAQAASPTIITIAFDMIVTSSLCIVLSRLDGADEHGAAKAVRQALRRHPAEPDALGHPAGRCGIRHAGSRCRGRWIARSRCSPRPRRRWPCSRSAPCWRVRPLLAREHRASAAVAEAMGSAYVANPAGAVARRAAGGRDQARGAPAVGLRRRTGRDGARSAAGAPGAWSPSCWSPRCPARATCRCSPSVSAPTTGGSPASFSGPPSRPSSPFRWRSAGCGRGWRYGVSTPSLYGSASDSSSQRDMSRPCVPSQ